MFRVRDSYSHLVHYIRPKKEKSSFSIQLGINSATAGDFTCNDVLAWDKKESCFYGLRLANCEIDARRREHFVTTSNEITAISLLEGFKSFSQAHKSKNEKLLNTSCIIKFAYLFYFL